MSLMSEFFCMSSAPNGLQFVRSASSSKISTSAIGRDIIAAALEAANPDAAQVARQEHNWRKTYPKHFKALVHSGLQNSKAAVRIAEAGLAQAHQHCEFFRDGQAVSFQDMLQLDASTLFTYTLKGSSNAAPEWYVPYRGQKLKGDALLAQIATWETQGIIEPSHAFALREAVAHPEWFDLSDRYMVLFGAASEAGPLTWLAKWKANIIAVDLNHDRVWNKILNTVLQGNATLYAPSLNAIDAQASIRTLAETLGTNLLTHVPEIAQWLMQFEEDLDLAATAYLDGEKHVRVSLAMDAIMSHVSQQKPKTSLMYMCTPTDVYAVPENVIQAIQAKSQTRSKLKTTLSNSIAKISAQHFFHDNELALIEHQGKSYGISDCLVIEQGPNYALAKRLQQWRATLAHQNGQRVSINIAPSTTTHSVTKNPLLKAAFNGAKLFDVEAFDPSTTNALMAALWIYDLRHPESVANPEVQLNHPLELMMQGANHGGLWRVPYLARTALPFAALYGFMNDNPATNLLKKITKR